jgi:hypothetical protein
MVCHRCSGILFFFDVTAGFSHSAFTFAHESLVMRSTVAQVDIPAGALITFLQKGLEYVGIEEHINDDGSVREFEGEYSLLSPFICDAIAVKEERRYRKMVPSNNAAPNRTLVAGTEADGTVSDGHGAMEVIGSAPSSQMASLNW